MKSLLRVTLMRVCSMSQVTIWTKHYQARIRPCIAHTKMLIAFMHNKWRQFITIITQEAIRWKLSNYMLKIGATTHMFPPVDPDHEENAYGDFLYQTPYTDEMESEGVGLRFLLSSCCLLLGRSLGMINSSWCIPNVHRTGQTCMKQTCRTSLTKTARRRKEAKVA